MPNKLDVKIDTGVIKDTILNFIVPLVCFGVSALLVFLVIYPSIQKMPSLQTDLQNKVAMRTQLETKVSVLDKLQDYKSVLEENLNLVDKVLVSEDNVPYLLNQIDKISRDVGFNLGKLNYGHGGSADLSDGSVGAEYVAVNLGVTGTYTQVVKFLQNVEKSARLVNVSNFRYGLSSSDVSNTSLSLSFLLYSPYLKVSSTASTDEPINLDLTNDSFIKTINYLKAFTYYDNQAPEATIKAEEKPLAEIETTPTSEAVETVSSTEPVAEPTPEPTPTPAAAEVTPTPAL